jgi:Small Multidrug Resistance protein
MNGPRSLLHFRPWIYLLVAGVAEMGFTTFMKLSNGFRNWTFQRLLRRLPARQLRPLEPGNS